VKRYLDSNRTLIRTDSIVQGNSIAWEKFSEN